MRLIGHSVSDATGVMLSMDSAACDLLQRSRRDLIGRSYLEITHPADRRRNAALVDRLPAEAAPVTLRKRYLTPDGGSVEADVHVSRLDTGAHTRLIGTLYHVEADDTRYAPAILWGAAHRLAQLTALRRDLLGSDLFCDHALTILLEMYLDEAEGRASDIATLARRIGLEPPAALRWLRALAAKDLIEWVGREDVVQLTGTGVRKLVQILAIGAP